MDITIKTVKGVVVVELVGRIDGRTTPDVEREILPLVQPGSRIVLDMTRVTYMSSAGLRFLVAMYRQVAGSDAALVLAGLSEKIRDTMSITGFLAFFSTSETVEDALAGLN